MNIVTARSISHEAGPLTQLAMRYSAMIEERATAKGSSAADWKPLEEFVAVDTFRRVGAYQEVMSWPEYVSFLSQWAGSTRFEATIFHISEIGRAVFQEIEERHYKGDEFIRKNVIAVYRFNAANKIEHLDIYEQARDTGRWIIEAARASVDTKTS